MTNKLRSFFSLLALVLCVTFSATAQELTGTIEGTITDPAGAIVPGVEVTVASRQRDQQGAAGTAVGFRRTVTTDGNGFFRVQQVPPGWYVVTTAPAAGFGAATANNIEVSLGRATQVNVALAVGGQAIQVDVTADTTAIDTTGSKIQTNITQRTAELLPKGTGFTSLLNLSPAVRAETNAGGFQIDGASGSENTFIIDGQEVSNFRTGTLNANNNIPFQFVQEVQVKSSGFEAEFGGATGGVVNVVTRGGGNEFRGETGVEFQPAFGRGDNRPFLNRTQFGPNSNSITTIAEYIDTPKDEGTDFFPYFSLGGPIVKDRAWFFASYAPQFINRDRRLNLYSTSAALRDPATRQFISSDVYALRQTNEYAFGRLDVQLHETLRLNASYLWNPIEQLGNLPAQTPFGTTPAIPIVFNERGLLRGPDLANFQGGRQSSNNTTGSLVWTPTDRFVMTARGGYSFLNEKLGNYGIPNVASGALNRYLTNSCSAGVTAPAGYQQCGTSNFGAITQTVFDVSRRRTFDADASYLVSNMGGRHQFKGGVQWNGISNSILSSRENLVISNFGSFTINSLSGSDNVPTSPGIIGAGWMQRFGASGSAGSNNLALYFQDSWQPVRRLTLNLGLRTEREHSPSFNALGPGITFDFADKIAPRLGFAWDVFGDGKTKLFGSYGRFFDRFKYELPRGSFGGNFFRNDYFEIFPSDTSQTVFTTASILGGNLDPIGGTCPIAPPGGNPMAFPRSRCSLDFRIPSNIPGQAAELGQVDPDLKAFRQSEYTVGFERALGSDFLLRSRYTHKQVDVAVEDIGVHVPGGEIYTIGNPGFGLAAQNYEANGYVPLKAIRDYDAVEVSLDKRFVNNYYFNVSYVWSRLWGNYAGLASSDEAGRTSPNVNRNFDLPFIGFDGNGGPDNGRLPTDRPHQFKAYGAYEIPWSATNSTEISAFTTIMSGTPVTTRYGVFGVDGQILNGRGDLGRTETFTQTDLGLRHRYRFGADKRFSLVGMVDVLNLFDEDNETGVFESRTLASNRLSAANLGIVGLTREQAEALYQRQAFAGAANAYIDSAAGAGIRDLRYGLSNAFQGPRAIRFGVKLQF